MDTTEIVLDTADGIVELGLFPITTNGKAVNIRRRKIGSTTNQKTGSLLAKQPPLVFTDIL